jgi:hypothetical protein
VPALSAADLLVILVVGGVLGVLPLAGAIALVVMLIRDWRRGRSGSELRAENRALEARTAARDEKAPSELFPSRWRVWWPWLLGVLMLCAVAALLGWPR